MNTLEEFRKNWSKDNPVLTGKKLDDRNTLMRIINSRVKKHMKSALQYFWTSLTLQVIVYTMLCVVIIKYHKDPGILAMGITGVLIYIPFTAMFVKKFRYLVMMAPEGNTVSSLYAYTYRHYNLVYGFYRFKKRYESALIPVSAIIGIVITFNLFVPGGIVAHPAGALVSLAITLLSCAWSVYSENKKNFEAPLERLNTILEEFRNEEYT